MAILEQCNATMSAWAAFTTCLSCINTWRIKRKRKRKGHDHNLLPKQEIINIRRLKIQLTANFFVFHIPTINTHPSNCTMTRRSSTGALWATIWGNPCLCLSFSPAPCGGPSRYVTALKFVSAQNVTLPKKMLSVIKHNGNPMILF